MPKHEPFKLVSITFLSLQKKVSPRWRQECKLVLEIVRNDFECLIDKRFVMPTSGVIEMLASKLKWIGRGKNLCFKDLCLRPLVCVESV